jgi:phosphatidylserine decarboxylase
MFHKEGFTIIVISTLAVGSSFILIDRFVTDIWWNRGIGLILLVVYLLILQFFRNPKRTTPLNDRHVIAPVDGKVVVIEEVHEDEYFQDRRIQVSVFMSPLNVHVTRYPVGGKVLFSKYHPGKYLVAWHPKASTANERTTVVVENPIVGPFLYRQIAGALAKRIVNYAEEGETVVQGEDSGFIKFGSRVDIFLPLNSELKVELGQALKGGIDCIATV